MPRSSSNISLTVLPQRWRAESAIRSHSASQWRAGCPWLSALGGGTIRLRRRKPTAFSTEPFSLPEYGLQNRDSSL